MQVQLWSPDELYPATCIVLRSAHVRGYEKSFVLGEELGLPVAIEGVGGIHEAVRDRTAAGQKAVRDLVLPIASLDACAGGEPIAGAAFNGPSVPANCVSNQEAFVGVSVEVLAVCEEMIWTEVFSEAMRTDGFDAQVHVRQER